MNKDVRNLNGHERFKLISQLDIDKDVFTYVKTKFINRNWWRLSRKCY